MICPHCGGRNYHVEDSRERRLYIRRRRVCNDCGKKFLTHEYVVQIIKPRKVKKNEAVGMPLSGTPMSDFYGES